MACAKLQKMDSMRPITAENDRKFLHHLQDSLLLALAEKGLLDHMQLRSAREQLNRRQRVIVKKTMDKAAKTR